MLYYTQKVAFGGIFPNAKELTLEQHFIIEELIAQHGADILACAGMQYEKTQPQHYSVSCYEHSVAVAYVSVWLALRFGWRVDYRSLVRGALLHDYFLYNWRDKEHTRPHAFLHARVALENASRDFELNAVERDVILRHMFPLNIGLPRYKESLLVTLADKICALRELSRLPMFARAYA